MGHCLAVSPTPLINSLAAALVSAFEYKVFGIFSFCSPSFAAVPQLVVVASSRPAAFLVVVTCLLVVDFKK